MRRSGRIGRRSAAQAAGGHDASRDRWLISYADLLTLLFALFVVLYAASDSDRARRVVDAISLQLGGPARSAAPTGPGVMPTNDAFTRAADAVHQTFASDPAAAQLVRVHSEERGLVISLAEAGFFAPGTAEVRDDALSTVDKIAAALQKSNVAIRVEGHTDATPISTVRFPSNWELSAARASSVAARLMQRGLTPGRLSIAGFGGERPVADNATADGRAQNRRVDIVVLKSAQ